MRHHPPVVSEGHMFLTQTEVSICQANGFAEDLGDQSVSAVSCRLHSALFDLA